MSQEALLVAAAEEDRTVHEGPEYFCVGRSLQSLFELRWQQGRLQSIFYIMLFVRIRITYVLRTLSVTTRTTIHSQREVI